MINWGQRMCMHQDLEENRHYGKYSGYVYQCPLCKAYVAYYEPLQRMVRISKKGYDFYIERNKEDERKAD